jgi:hypothetical protein
MRNGQNKRMRGRNNNHRKNHNPMVRVYESNGPDVKIRGNPSHIAEKYIQLARDAQTSGDPIAAENYYQHAEHYYRVIAVAQEQFRQNNPHFARGENETQGARDDGFDDGDDDGQSMGGPGDSPYGTREPQPYIPRDAQPFPQQPPQQPQRPQQGNAAAEGDVERLPSFITGGQQPQQQPHQGQQPGPNGHDNQPDRFPLHRRRRRHRGPRPDAQGGGGDGGDEPTARE